MLPSPVFHSASAGENLAFTRERGFGLLSVNGSAAPLAAHVPFVLDADSASVEGTWKPGQNKPEVARAGAAAEIGGGNWRRRGPGTGRSGGTDGQCFAVKHGQAAPERLH